MRSPTLAVQGSPPSPSPLEQRKEGNGRAARRARSKKKRLRAEAAASTSNTASAHQVASDTATAQSATVAVGDCLQSSLRNDLPQVSIVATREARQLMVGKRICATFSLPR